MRINYKILELLVQTVWWLAGAGGGGESGGAKNVVNFACGEEDVGENVIVSDILLGTS